MISKSFCFTSITGPWSMWSKCSFYLCSFHLWTHCYFCNNVDRMYCIFDVNSSFFDCLSCRRSKFNFEYSEAHYLYKLQSVSKTKIGYSDGNEYPNNVTITHTCTLKCYHSIFLNCLWNKLEKIQSRKDVHKKDRLAPSYLLFKQVG